MPAIQIAILRRQTAQLIGLFYQPRAFVRELHDILSFYADHTRRPGQSGEPPPLLEAYHVPAPVLRSIERELKTITLSSHQAALELSDGLWGEPYLEFRILAAGLLGMVPPDPPEPVVERLQKWIERGVEGQLLDTLLTQGLARLRSEDVKTYLELISNWLASTDFRQKQFGFQALLPLVTNAGLENFPVVFRLLTPYVRSTAESLKPDVVAILVQLARRSPQETAYFLRQNLAAPDNPDTARFIRSVWHEFPENIRENLRQAIKQEEKAL